MPRRNYRTRNARKRHTVEYVIAEMRADYEVTLTNGSGFTKIIVTGTSVSAWNWAVRAGQEGGVKPGNWWPVEIRAIDKNDAIFSAI